VRFIIMHKTNAHWEGGAIPDPELCDRVGRLIGEMAGAGILQAGEGLRPSSEGVRLRFSPDGRSVTHGPFERGNELPAGFSIVRTATLEEAVAWATRLAEAQGEVELDIRPVTEAWDIGMVPRPASVTTRRYMILRKATAATEGGVSPSPAQRAEAARLVEETTRTGVHLVTETMRPSARGRRYKNAVDGVSFVDGPFIESKELIGGYVVLATESLADTDAWVRRYIAVVGAQEVDVRELG
jgi:hypothetical protein